MGWFKLDRDLLNYVCNGSDPRYILHLFSTVPPVISSQGGTVTVVVNEAAKLECEASGVPTPSLTWLKDGSPVSHDIQVPYLFSDS